MAIFAAKLFIIQQIILNRNRRISHFHSQHAHFGYSGILNFVELRKYELERRNTGYTYSESALNSVNCPLLNATFSIPFDLANNNLYECTSTVPLFPI